MVRQIRRRVIRKLRQLAYLEASIDAPIATGYEPLAGDEPELARTMAVSGQQRIACGEQAGQKVRRIGSDLGDEDERPWRTGTRCANGNGCSLHATTPVPAPRRAQWERLIRSTDRGAMSLARRFEEARGAPLSTVPKSWSNGPPGMTLSPGELLEKLAAGGPAPAGAFGPVWRLSSATQSAASHPHAHTASPGGGSA